MSTIYRDSGINWNWYLEATVNEDHSVTIHRHWRMHKYDHPNHPESSGSFRLHESPDDKRTVIAVTLDNGAKQTVTNPKYIFDYRE